MKTRAGYWISGALIVVAIVGALGWVGTSLSEMTEQVNAFERVGVGEEETVRLEARKYVIYAEGENGDEFPPTLLVTITDSEGRAEFSAPYASELTYSFGGHEGSAQATVTPDRAGDYRIRVRSAGFGDAARATGVALGESLSPLLLRSIFGAILIGAIFGLSGIALLATTIVRRHNARKGPYTGPPPVFVPAPPPHVQAPAHEPRTPYEQDDPPPPYGQTPSPGDPPPRDDPPPPLWRDPSR